MLHNKYLLILNQYLNDYQREIYGRELIKTVSLSQKNIALTLHELEHQGILRSRRAGTLIYYKLNAENKCIHDILILAEVFAKLDFCEQHQKIAHLFKRDNRIVGIFGSYAKGHPTKESDIDLFIVGKKIPADYDRQGTLFNLPISIHYFSEKEFKQLLKGKNTLVNEIVNNHILVFGIETFIDIVWRYYYGYY